MQNSVEKTTRSVNNHLFLNKDADKYIKLELAKEPILKFDEYSYEKKLETLYDYEQKLISNDKTRKSNRRGISTICRMRGSLS
jgi:hypothetical protein